MDLFTGLFYVVSSLVSYGDYKRQKKQAEAAAFKADNLLLNTVSNNAPIPIIYGERRVGGTIVFKDTQTGSRKRLYYALVLCEGGVESVTDIKIDDVPITDARFNGYVEHEIYLGTDNQSQDALLDQALPSYENNFNLNGVAYIALRFEYNSEVFGKEPAVTALVKGKKVYDPRTGSTAYSNNPALCLRDYLINPRYGRGMPSDAVDDVAFSEAANDCDQEVTFYTSGTTGKLFECNAVLNSDDSSSDFEDVQKLQLGMRGFIPYMQGKYSLIIDKARDSVFDFSQDHILGGIKILGETKENKFNRAVLTFPNPEANWQSDNAIWPNADSAEEAAYLAEDGEVLELAVELETTTNYYAARDLARILVLRSRNALRCSLNVTSEGFQVISSDIVTVSHPTPGWNQKPFQVEQIALNNDGTCSLQLLEYDPTIYAYESSPEQSTYPDTNLPDVFSVPPPTALTATPDTVTQADGSITAVIAITWTAPDDAFVISYDLTVTDSGGNAQTFPVVGTRYEFNANPGATYGISVQSVNNLGVKSQAVAVTGVQAIADTTAPGLPINIAKSGNFERIDLSWTNPTDSDFSHVSIKRSLTTVESQAVVIDQTPSNTYTDGPFESPATYFYWLASVDRTGNYSAWQWVGPVTSHVLGASDIPIDDATIKPNSQNALQVYFDGETLAFDANFERQNADNGALVVNRDDATITSGANGIEIKDLGVDTGKIKDNAVTITAAATRSPSNSFFANTTTWFTVCDLSFTSIGSNVFISWDANMSASSTAYVSFKLMRSNLTDLYFWSGFRVKDTQSFSASFLDENNSTGTVTYQLKAKKESGGQLPLPNTSLSIIEIKK